MVRELNLTVEPVAGGWVVRHLGWTSPVLSEDQALDLAHGMASAVNQIGDRAEVRVWAREH
jgi:hypothetical protein